MERVIVLSMFKKIVNRLFGPEDENKEEHIEKEYEQVKNESKTTSKNGRMPAFRFPVISDEEIYGSGQREQREAQQRENPKSLS